VEELMSNIIARRTLLVLGTVAAAAFFILFASRDVGAQEQFFTPCGGYEFASTAPNTTSDITATFGIGIGPDCILRSPDDNRAQYNTGGLISFTPEAWGVAAGADIPDGSKIGTLHSDAVLGLFNNPCRTELTVNFDLVDGSIDTSDTIDAKPFGTTDRLSVLKDDTDGNGVMDGADRWPSYLNELFDHVPDLQSTVHARLFGVNATAVPGLTVVLNFMIFKPGTQVSELIAIDPRLGYQSVTVLNDPTGAAAPDSAVNDFCAPLYTNTVLTGKDASGADFRTNPGDGAYNFVTFTASQRDADGDGIENALDPCPYTPDPDWNPRGETVQNPGDQDGDLLPDSCDPFPTEQSLCTAASGLSRTDEDCDKWMNSADNCPLVPNTDQLENESDRDAIGDACDQNPTSLDGPVVLRCIVTTVQVGAGGTPAVDPQELLPCNPNGVMPAAETPTPVGQTPKPTTAGSGSSNTSGGSSGGVGGASSAGIGTLSPTGTSAPMWALLAIAIGALGLLGGMSLATRRVRAERRDE
jgi:hypothetical protein